MINDPFDLIHPPTVEDSELLEEEPEDYHDRFWDDVPYSGRSAQGGYGIHTQVCRFDDEGNHVQMAKDCPHYDAVDEQGPRIVPGWTVQSNRR